MLRKLTALSASLALLLSLTSCGGAPTTPPDIAILPTEPSSGTTTAPKDGEFEIHFIDVGQADSALVACDGHYMLIDGGNAEDSDLIYSYLETHGVKHLDYMIATHAHEDHIGGLSGALTYATVDVAYSPVTEGTTKVFKNMVENLKAQGKKLTVPNAGQSFSLGSADVTILGPLKEYRDTNDTSIVLRVDYGETSFLFTGDMETGPEKDLVEAGLNLDADVLKVGHHGSDSSSSYLFLREVTPDYAVISVGEGNKYNHPQTEILERLRDVEAELYRTDLQGTIIASSDGETITFTTERKADTTIMNPTITIKEQYIGNIKSKKFHRPDCSSAEDIEPENQTIFESRPDAVKAGYDPCGRCKP